MFLVCKIVFAGRRDWWPVFLQYNHVSLWRMLAETSSNELESLSLFTKPHSFSSNSALFWWFYFIGVLCGVLCLPLVVSVTCADTSWSAMPLTKFKVLILFPANPPKADYTTCRLVTQTVTSDFKQISFFFLPHLSWIKCCYQIHYLQRGLEISSYQRQSSLRLNLSPK